MKYLIAITLFLTLTSSATDIICNRYQLNSNQQYKIDLDQDDRFWVYRLQLNKDNTCSMLFQPKLNITKTDLKKRADSSFNLKPARMETVIREEKTPFNKGIWEGYKQTRDIKSKSLISDKSFNTYRASYVLWSGEEALLVNCLGREKSDLNKFDTILENITNISRTEKLQLKPTEFVVKNKDTRSLKYNISVPRTYKGNVEARIYVRHSADDSGDKGMTYRILKKKEQLQAGSMKSKDWTIIPLDVKQGQKYTFILEDLDTKFTGKYPGNGGEIKITLCYNK